MNNVSEKDTTVEDENKKELYQDYDLYLDKLKLLTNRNNKGKYKIPMKLLKKIVKEDVISLSDHNERALSVIKILYGMYLNSSTAIKYFVTLKPYLYPQVRRDLRIMPLQFNMNAIRPRHSRGDDFSMFETLLNYIMNNYPMDDKLLPFVFIYYTALRAFEALSLTCENLQELARQSEYVKLIRKGIKKHYWRPIYFEEFNKFVLLLCDKYKNLIEKSILIEIADSTRVFNYSYCTLNNDFKNLFRKVFKTETPFGFGVHWFRYFISSRIVKSGNLNYARVVLNHRYVWITKRYLRYDNSIALSNLSKLKDNHVYNSSLIE